MAEDEPDDKPADAGAEQEEGEPTLPPPIVTAEMIAAVDLEAVLAPVADEDDHKVERQLSVAAKAAREAGEVERALVLELFAAIMYIAVRPDDEASPFAAMIIMDGRRSMIPDDIAGEQSAILAEVVGKLPNRHLRAKVGDVVFYNSRKHWRAAAVAIPAYCEIARGRLEDTIRPRPLRPADSIMDVIEPLARATALAKLTKKRGDMPDEVRNTLTACYSAALSGNHYAVFVKLAELALWNGILSPDQVANDAEQLARGEKADAYPMVVKGVWLVAAGCHDRLNADDSANRCRMEAAEQTLKMRDQSDQASVKAHWTKAALGEMRHIPGSRDRVQQLREELKTLQLSAGDDFVTWKTPIDLSETVAEIKTIFERISFSDACLHFSNMAGAPPKQELREIVLKLAHDHPLGAMIGSSYYDAEGREAARVPPMPTDGPPSEDWYRSECGKYMDLIMQQQVRGKIEPARLFIAQRASIQERHVLPLAEASPFVPPAREPLFALGFARMFQGDYATAAHLLFPQLENSLRHILMMANRDPSKIEQDLIQGDRTLSALLEVNGAELEAILGEDIVHEIEILFNFRPGPALRNEAAHGKLPWGAFFHHTTIFGCWFIFGLTCRPLFRVWREHVAPRLEEEIAGALED